jgi:hypothetical protein
VADKSATRFSYGHLPAAQDRRCRSAPLACLAFLLAWALPGSALAYNEGGHYYTLVALLDSQPDNATPRNPDQLRLEAFCAELPDMTLELDATSQRLAVLRSSRDNAWGLLGYCQTPLSAHMVAVQCYLHGLTGTPVEPLRNAALSIIQDLTGKLAGARDAAKRKELLCARGFAIHLLGDSFAHATLSSDSDYHRHSWVSGIFSADTMKTYPTGAGHLFDGHKPDYIGSHRENSWDKFVQTENSALLSPPLAGKPLASLLSCKADCGISQSCESEDQDNLHRLIEQNEGPTHRVFINDMEQLIRTENTDFMGFELADTCQEVVDKVYGSTGPDCSSVWATYLGAAIEAFNEWSIDPTNRPGATASHSCSAWRCSGSSGYAGERYGSCEPQIIDALKMGIPQ